VWGHVGHDTDSKLLQVVGSVGPGKQLMSIVMLLLHTCAVLSAARAASVDMSRMCLVTMCIRQLRLN
jgi:hypothetical protein